MRTVYTKHIVLIQFVVLLETTNFEAKFNSLELYLKRIFGVGCRSGSSRGVTRHVKYLSEGSPG